MGLRPHAGVEPLRFVLKLMVTVIEGYNGLIGKLL
jgi:hypothetical protein